MKIFISIVIIATVVGIYNVLQKKKSRRNIQKINKAKEYGLHEPVHIHPFVDPSTCIGSGACVKSCPEHDIIGLVNGKASLINASRCIGHGACAIACPVGAINLVFGTETRGVDIPSLTPNFETNIKGIYIVGELGGMGLIKNAVTQGREVIEYINCSIRHSDAQNTNICDVLIVGAGPAGISASLAAVKYKMNFVTVEQDDIGGTVLQYPRHKIVMTSPMELPMYGKVRLKIKKKEKLLDIKMDDGCFKVFTSKGDYLTKNIVLAIGRRGTPRKLGVPGENLPKVSYRLLEPEQHQNQDILVVGGGDSAVEAAIALSDQPKNRVALSYRGEAFSRIKPANKERLDEKVSKKALNAIFKSNVKEIGEKYIKIATTENIIEIPNHYAYIFAGGELPNEFLNKLGVRIDKRFGT